MSKKKVFFTVLAAIILSLFCDALFGRWLAIKLSMSPPLKRFKLAGPQGPIVINNREEVRVSDSGDAQNALGSVRPKLSLVLAYSQSQILVLGGALNLTADGSFVTVKSAVSGHKPSDLTIKLDDGSLAPVTGIAADSATDLEILKTGANSVPVVNLAASKDAAPGQKIIFILPGQQNFSAVFQASFISQAQGADLSAASADAPGRGFKTQDSANLLPGQAAVDLNGEVLGLWDGSRFIASDVVKDLSDIYLSGRGQIIRPQFGFSYRLVSPAESSLSGQPAGARVLTVLAGSPAQKAGLLPNDVIVSWGQTDLNANSSLEEILANNKPGDAVAVKITRGKTSMVLNFIAGQLK